MIRYRQMYYRTGNKLPVEKLLMISGPKMQRACSACAGEYEDPDRTAPDTVAHENAADTEECIEGDD